MQDVLSPLPSLPHNPCGSLGTRANTSAHARHTIARRRQIRVDQCERLGLCNVLHFEVCLTKCNAACVHDVDGRS